MWLCLPRTSRSLAAAEDSTCLSESQCQRLSVSCTSSGKSVQPVSWRRVWKTGALTLLQSGLMCDPQNGDAIVDGWLESSGAFPVPICQSPESAPESTENIADSGLSTSAAYAKCNPDGSLSKMSPQSSLFQQEELYSEGLPKAGTMLSGYLFERPTWERPIAGSEYLSSPGDAAWKTPHGMGGLDASGKMGGAGGGEFAKQANQWQTPIVDPATYTYPCGAKDHTPFLTLRGEVENWPTPDANVMNDGESPESFEARRQRNIEKHVNGNGMGTPLAMRVQQWPSPRTEDSQECGNHPGAMDSLGVVKLWTTPQSHDVAAGNAARIGRYGSEHGGKNLTDDVMLWRTPDTRDHHAQGPRPHHEQRQTKLVDQVNEAELWTGDE